MDTQTIMHKIIKSVVDKYGMFRFVFLALSDFFITFFSCVFAIFIYTRILGVAFPAHTVYAIILTTYIVKLSLFAIFRIYDISFQHASVVYIFKTSLVIFVAVILNYMVLKTLFSAYWGVTVAIFELMIDVMASVAFRFAPLVYYEICGMMSKIDKNCLIYGCGDTGKGLIPSLKRIR